MTTTPPDPTPSRKSPGWRLRGLVLLVSGVVAYYGLELTDRLLADRLARERIDGVIEIVETVAESDPLAAPSTAARLEEGPGNPLLRRGAELFERSGSISAAIRQEGWLDGAAVHTQGVYHQSGGGDERKFLLEVTGELAGAPTRLLRLSDGQFLWTDLAWGHDPSHPERSVTRIDLREVRQLITKAGANASLDWSRFGGVPMLLAGLDEAFTFGPPHRMHFRGDTVLAMVGRWRESRRGQLVEGGTLPRRAPQHVVIALSEADSFPRLIEYRDARDPLSDEGMPDESMLRPSTKPLLKIELARRPIRAPHDPRLFAYRASDDNWVDRTDRELRLLRDRHSGAGLLAEAPTERR
ncbi:hypothetical protein MalM25_24450 [Planctomycetes bacterium MalM25]|nr:hypothetical protein MalM25_24450 [Planctomycetes bacterium MalM25]